MSFSALQTGRRQPLVHDYFVFGGVSSRDAGITLRRPVTVSGATPRVETVSVPGRSGDLHFYDGSYENRELRAECFVLQHQAEKAMTAIVRWLLMAPDYQRLELASEPEHFRMARIVRGPDRELRAGLLAPFALSFDCKPQRFLKSGEQIITLEAPGTLYNTGFPALPRITVYGSGEGKLSVGDTVVMLKNIDGHVILDAEVQDAYKGNANRNSTISAPAFPVLQTGENCVSWSGGITHVNILPRWWTL